MLPTSYCPRMQRGTSSTVLLHKLFLIQEYNVREGGDEADWTTELGQVCAECLYAHCEWFCQDVEYNRDAAERMYEEEDEVECGGERGFREECTVVRFYDM